MNATPANLTIAQHFLDTVQKRKDQPLVWEKRRNIYQSLSWKEIATRVNLMTRALSVMGLQKHERVVNFLPNNSSCMILDIAVMALGAVSVNIPDDYTQDEAFTAILECQTKIAFIHSEALGAMLINAENEQVKNLEFIVIPDSARLNPKDRIKVMTWSMVMDKGKSEPDKFAQNIRATQAKDTIALLYTHAQDNSLFAIKRSHADVFKLCDRLMSLY